MKKYILLSVVIFLTACASSKKEMDTSVDELEQTPIGSIEVTRAEDELEPAAPVAEPAVKRETPANAYAPLSEAYRSQNDEAISRAAIQILSQNPTDEKALNAMGLYHYRKGRFLAAKYFFSRAALTHPKSSALQNNLGLANLALGENTEGLKQFKKALELNPQDGIAAANLGSIYVQEKDFSKAQIALEIALKNGMKETRTMTNYGISLSALGKTEAAKAALDEALKMSGNNKEAMLASAVLLIDQMKQYSQGLEMIERLKFLSPVADMRNRMNTLENKAKAGIK